jgi:NAD(P)-dependent dehydrogenase (short-subunit alcohol dehydrogenase family)
MEVNVMGVARTLRNVLPLVLDGAVGRQAGRVCHVINTASVAGIAATTLGSHVQYLQRNTLFRMTERRACTGSAFGESVQCTFPSVQYPLKLPTRVFDAGGRPKHNRRYGVSKHGCAALSECLHLDLVEMGRGGDVKVHVLCPGIVNTDIVRRESQRPNNTAFAKAASVETASVADAVKREVSGEVLAAFYREHGLTTSELAKDAFAQIEVRICILITKLRLLRSRCVFVS